MKPHPPRAAPCSTTRAGAGGRGNRGSCCCCPCRRQPCQRRHAGPEMLRQCRPEACSRCRRRSRSTRAGRRRLGARGGAAERWSWQSAMQRCGEASAGPQRRLKPRRAQACWQLGAQAAAQGGNEGARRGDGPRTHQVKRRRSATSASWTEEAHRLPRADIDIHCRRPSCSQRPRMALAEGVFHSCSRLSADRRRSRSPLLQFPLAHSFFLSLSLFHLSAPS